MEEGMNVFSIKDLENFSGIKAHTIRIWEKRYNLLEPDRTDSNIRTYSENELKKILNVAYLNRSGFKISRIAHLSDDELNRQVISFSSRDENNDRNFQPGKILMPALRFNELQFKEALEPFLRNHPIEESYILFFHPLLEKSKILWQTGSMTRAQEQFVRNSIRQLLIVEDNNIKMTSARKTKASVAMINTYSNLSDNNFLFYKYVLKKRGYDVIYTGGILPASEITEIHKIKPFEYLVVNSGAFDFSRIKIGYFNTIGKSLFIKKIILTDFPELKEKKIPENIIITRNPEDFLKAVTKFE
jgi:MerR family transcriptional regulator, light-induced transcriptional regulator